MSARRFSDLKQQIMDALRQKGDIGINEPVTLLEGFFNTPIQTELSGNFVIGGPSLPMIALIGNTTGRLYFFALKAIIPDLGI